MLTYSPINLSKGYVSFWIIILLPYKRDSLHALIFSEISEKEMALEPKIVVQFLENFILMKSIYFW
ncbi:hypothetical protein ES15_2082 [Cronobacter sakazakii ES15]|nr:hypothetical protein ES15_2082 [Cronobacter sakazakii ES15]